MIDKPTLIKKLGKKKFKDFVVNERSNQPTGADRERKPYWGRVKHKMCEHGRWIIDNYEPKKCSDCAPPEVKIKGKDFKPYFNIGLGCYVESRSDEKKAARSLGLLEAG